ncbi:MAG: hypothetical protein ACI9P8_000173 [Bacteroidia bacterium]|jgi:hypothetical protein
MVHTMKRTFSLAFTMLSILLFSNPMLAQQATLSAGGDATGPGGSASFSIGQVAYQHVSDLGGSVNEGVQHALTGDCIQPIVVSLGFTNTSHHGTTINWVGQPVLNSGKFVIRYHVFGDSPNFSYKVVPNGFATSAYINGLDPATRYVFRVGTKCPGNVFATFSDTASVVTKAYCAPPTGMAAAPSFFSATLSWDDVGADSYKLKYREVGGTWDYRNTALTSVDLTGLSAGNQYEWKVRSICTSGMRPYVNMQQFNTPAGRLAASGSGINKFNVYPNPTHDNLTVAISSDIDQAMNLELTDLSGRIVGQELVQANAGGVLTTLNLANLVSGIYFVRVLSANGSILHTEKISRY